MGFLQYVAATEQHLVISLTSEGSYGISVMCHGRLQFGWSANWSILSCHMNETWNFHYPVQPYEKKR